MNFPKFPVVFPRERGVIERLPSIGDRVHHPCESMGTIESFDQDGNWSKFIRFRQRLTCCMFEISIRVSSQGACLFLGYLDHPRPSSQCDMHFHGSCERRKGIVTTSLQGDFKVKMSNGTPAVWYAHKCWAPSFCGRLQK